MDFTYSSDDFDSFIAVANRDWLRSKEALDRYLKHWQEMSREESGGLYSLAVEDGLISGLALGKPFFLSVSPRSIEKTGFAEVVLLTESLNATKIEGGRFLVDRDGAIFDGEGVVLFDAGSRHLSWTLLTSIIRSVVAQPAITSFKGQL